MDEAMVSKAVKPFASFLTPEKSGTEDDPALESSP
jgi:hypothetical protein